MDLSPARAAEASSIAVDQSSAPACSGQHQASAAPPVPRLPASRSTHLFRVRVAAAHFGAVSWGLRRSRWTVLHIEPNDLLALRDNVCRQVDMCRKHSNSGL
jgi:hypothetical protein